VAFLVLQMVRVKSTINVRVGNRSSIEPSPEHKLSAHVIELIKDHKDEEALLGIQKEIGCSPAIAKEVLQTMRPFISKSTNVTSFKHFEYRLPDNVLELVKQHQDKQALSEIEKATGLDDTSAERILEQLREVADKGKNVFGHVQRKFEFHKVPSGVMKSIREGRDKESIDWLVSEYKMSTEEAQKLVEQIRDREFPPI